MTSFMPQIRTCPHCKKLLPPEPIQTTDKVQAMLIGSVVVLAAIALRVMNLVSEWGLLTMLAFGLGVAFHHRFTGTLRLWKKGNGAKSA